MRIVVLTNESLKEELLAGTIAANESVVYIEDISQIHSFSQADAYVDLLFEREHVDILKKFLPKLVIINSVVETLAETDTSFVRINAWPTFLRSGILEASSLKEEAKQQTEKTFSFFNKEIQWLPDEQGFVTPRVISMIINEAFISLGEGVSTKEDINAAMKLGTNYPYGPFEWAKKIGMKKISLLLYRLSEHNSRYTPSSLLEQEFV